jgi:hypothetical protein
MSVTKKLTVDLDILAETFDLRTGDGVQLTEWLKMDAALTDFENILFEKVFVKSKRSGHYWNEEELKMHLVSPLLTIADIETDDKVKIFFERPLSAVIDGYALHVVTDCMIACPMRFNKPKKPYFFLQEYKKGRGDDKDPEAQMLAAMLIAQYLHQEDLPIYGSYVIGNQWCFATLLRQEYCTSETLRTDKREELLQICKILKNLKVLIFNRL